MCVCIYIAKLNCIFVLFFYAGIFIVFLFILSSKMTGLINILKQNKIKNYFKNILYIYFINAKWHFILTCYWRKRFTSCIPNKLFY